MSRSPRCLTAWTWPAYPRASTATKARAHGRGSPFVAAARALSGCRGPANAARRVRGQLGRQHGRAADARPAAPRLPRDRGPPAAPRLCRRRSLAQLDRGPRIGEPPLGALANPALRLRARRGDEPSASAGEDGRRRRPRDLLLGFTGPGRGAAYWSGRRGPSLRFGRAAP